MGADPTNRQLAGERHVKIGHGRHYSDVPPVRGVRRLGAMAAFDVAAEDGSPDPDTTRRVTAHAAGLGLGNLRAELAGKRRGDDAELRDLEAGLADAALREILGRHGRGGSLKMRPDTDMLVTAPQFAGAVGRNKKGRT